MSLIKSSIWSIISVSIRSIVLFVLNKLFAVYYGPQGITLLSHFQNLLSIFLTVPNDGVNKGIIKYTADETMEQSSFYPILNAGLILNVLIFIISLSGLFIFKSFFENPFPGTNNFWLGIVCFLAFLQLMNLTGLSLLLAREKIRAFVIIQIIGNLLSLGFAGTMIFMASFQEALLAWAAGPAFTLIITFFYLRFNLRIRWRNTLIFPSSKYLSKLGEYILMALSIVIFSKAVDFFIRQYAIGNFETNLTGHWQSVVRISDLYLMAYVAILSMVYYPRVSGVANLDQKLKSFLNSFLLKVIALSGVFLILVFFLKEHLLSLLFDQAFKEAAWLFKYQLIGDWFKIISWIFSFLILAQSRTKLFISTQVLFAGIHIALIYFLIPQLGIESLTLSYCIKNALYLLFFLIYFRFYFSSKN